MSARVIIQNNVFTTSYIEKKVEIGTTLEQIIIDLNLNPEEDMVFCVINDEQASDGTYKVKENDIVLLRIVPKGQEEVGAGTIGLGSAALIAGIVLIATGYGAGVGVPLIIGGISTIISGIGVLAIDIPELENYTNPEVEGFSYLRGGKNTFGANQPIPLILGKHRYYPMLMASPYVEFVAPNSVAYSTTKDYKMYTGTKDTSGTPNTKTYDTSGYYAGDFVQSVHQLYLLGQREVQPITNTYKRGDTLISDLKGTSVLHNSYSNYGQDAKKYINVSRSLNAWDSDGYSRVEVILQSNITSIDVNLLFPVFYLLDGNGDNLTPKTMIRVEIFDKDNNDAIVYEHIFEISGKDGAMSSVVNAVAVSIPIPYTLDENTQYSVGVTRGHDNRNKSTDTLDGQLTVSDEVTQTSNIYLNSITCYSSKDVITSYANTTYSYLDVTVTDEAKTKEGDTILTGDIDDFNVILQTHIPVYSGVGSGRSAWTTTEATSNPASLYLYVLTGSPNGRPVDDAEIDWAQLERWYDFCDVNNLECNLVLDKPGSVENILKIICLCGRAEFIKNTKYSLVIDEIRSTPTQMLTDKNTYNISINALTYPQIHGYELTFIDEDTEYQTTTCERRIYRSGYNADGSGGKKLATKIEKLSIPGVTNYNQLVSLARYSLNVSERRTETLLVTMDWEYLWANIGDKVTVSYDELLIGLSRGRIKTVNRNGSNQVTDLVLDEEGTMEAGKTYGVTIRYASGQQITLPVINTEDTTQSFTLVTPTLVDVQVDDLYSFGEAGKETGEYIVISKTPSNDLKAQVGLVPYDPSIYIIGDLPPFVSNVTKPNNLGRETLITDPYTPTQLAQQTSSRLSNVDTLLEVSSKYSLKTNVPVATRLRSDALEIKLTIGKLWYIKKDDLKLYTSDTITVDGAEALLINKQIKTFDVNEDETYVVYSDVSEDNKIYLYDVVGDITTQITTVSGTSPILSEDDIYYINYDDGNKVYKTNISGGNGSVYIDYASSDISSYKDTVIWVNSDTGNLVIKDIEPNNPSIKGTIYSTKSVNSIIGSNPGLWYNTQDTLVALYVDADTGQSYTGIEAFYGDVVKHAINSVGDYAFIDSDGDLFYVSLFEENLKARMETIITEDAETFTCDLVNGDNRLRNISNDDLLKLAFNDDISGNGIPVNTRITRVATDGNYIVVNNPVGITSTGETLTVSGSRLQIDANRVVFPGTVTAGLLETDAMSSISRVPETAPVVENRGKSFYSHNHTTGVENQYDNDGNLIRQFDPSTGMWLREGIKIGGTAPGSGTVVPSAPAFTDTTNQIFRQALAPSGQGEIENDTWYDTDNGLLYAYKSGTWQVSSYTTAQLDALNIDAGTVNSYSIAKSVPSDALFSDTLPDEYFGAGGTAAYTGAGGSWGISSTGVLTASGANITGTINATDGTFAGTLSAADGTFTGDLTVLSDNENRKVEIGSKGLKVTDSGGRIVHDLPALSANNLVYLGHSYINTSFYDYDVINITGSSSTHPISSGSLNVDITTNTFPISSQCNVAGEVVIERAAIIGADPEDVYTLEFELKMSYRDSDDVVLNTISYRYNKVVNFRGLNTPRAYFSTNHSFFVRDTVDNVLLEYSCVVPDGTNAIGTSAYVASFTLTTLDALSYR